MKEKLSCHFCGKDVFRTKYQMSICKTNLYFCCRICKNLSQKESPMNQIPQLHPLIKVFNDIYSIDYKNEYLTNINIHKMDSEYHKTLGEYMVTATARPCNNAVLCSKTPDQIQHIKDCFSNIKINDFNNLANVKTNWKKIIFRVWNLSTNDITYEVES